MTAPSDEEFAASGTAAGGTRPVRSRLPRPRTSFVGREYEIAEVRNLLQDNRLLTLTGPGGCGKTRLAIALAADATDHFAQGVQFVSLAAIRDPSLVPVSIAQSIGLQDARGRSLLEHLSGYVGDGDVLLVLDNFEQVLAAGEFVSELLDATGRLRVLVTSRSPLHVSGEQEFPVPPLALPEGGPGMTAAAVAACESVRLFAERAAASVPNFTVNNQNAEAVTGIVNRLDGLPLAIELAAARVKLLPPTEILARLDNSLGLLVSSSRDLPTRQRTLRATIAWSYELLSDSARQLLAACSVFRGGIALNVIESVCAEAADLRIPVTMRSNAIAERWIASARRECLDRILITGERHLRLVLSECTDHYDGHRPRRPLQQNPPAGRAHPPAGTGGMRVLRRDRLGGLIHEYAQVA